MAPPRGGCGQTSACCGGGAQGCALGSSVGEVRRAGWCRGKSYRVDSGVAKSRTSSSARQRHRRRRGHRGRCRRRATSVVNCRCASGSPAARCRHIGEAIRLARLTASGETAANSRDALNVAASLPSGMSTSARRLHSRCTQVPSWRRSAHRCPQNRNPVSTANGIPHSTPPSVVYPTSKPSAVTEIARNASAVTPSQFNSVALQPRVASTKVVYESGRELRAGVS